MGNLKQLNPIKDATTESRKKEDTGCQISTSCIKCPLSRCKHDDPVWFQYHLRMAPSLKIWQTMVREDLTTDQAAERFSVSVRTIFRIMRRCQEAGEELGEEELEAFASTLTVA